MSSINFGLRMKTLSVLAAAAMAALAAAAEVNDAPWTENWSPSPWGADDKAGAVNRITPELVLKHSSLIKTGRYATLGKVYQADMPFFSVRAYKLTIPGLPTGGPVGDHRLVYNDEMITAELGQVGTQFDGPGHIGVRTSKGHFYYNGAIQEQVAKSYGLGRLGVEHVARKGYVCRGVLLNAAALRGQDRLPVPSGGDKNHPGNVSDQDIEAMIERQDIAPIGEGDCVFLYTGWGDIWHPREWDSYSAEEKQKRAAEFNAGEPGFGRSACDYLATRKVALVGADNWGLEAVPGENTKNPFECHAQMQPRNGIWFLENLDFSQLIEDDINEFLFVWAPLKLKGATGSPGNPIAIY